MALSEGAPSSPVGSQELRTPPEGPALDTVLLLEISWVSWVPLLQDSHTGAGKKEADPLRAQAWTPTTALRAPSQSGSRGD